MTALRRTFLTRFFAALEANGVRYCVLRNYADLYADTSTDVDLLVSFYSLRRFERCLREAAVATGFRLVQATRFVNYSRVFWHPQAGFIRIDFETEQRWRLLTVLTAREILDRRRRHEEFFVPHPEDETVILFLAAIWRGKISDRYCRQLVALLSACVDAAALRRRLVRAFGDAGEALADFQSQAIQGTFDQKLVQRARRGLCSLTLKHGWRLAAVLQNVRSDISRFVERLRRPAGLSIFSVSARQPPRNFGELARQLDVLFPPNKGQLESLDATSHGKIKELRGWRSRRARLRTLFKGGLLVRTFRARGNTDLTPIIREVAQDRYPDRTFVCGEDTTGHLYVAHVKTGFMVTLTSAPMADEQDFRAKLVPFLSEILERDASLAPNNAHRRGLFCALVGLDGSGKTTLARNVCDVAVAGARFNGVRYFHWRPKILGRIEFPLPEFRNLPRKSPQRRNPWNTLLSVARLAKNAALVNLAWLVKVRPLLQRGYLVLVDRYFYNYYLDPVSVRYTGPAWLLALAEKWFPRPHAVITLHAPAEILLQRKQELSEAEIRRQAATLQGLKFPAACVISADASEPAEIVARKIMAALIASQL